MEYDIKEIFNLIKNKDERGFSELYNNYYRMLYSCAYSILYDENLTEDAIQNTMIKLYNLSVDKFPESGEISWLYRVCLNETKMIKRGIKEESNLTNSFEPTYEDIDINKVVDMDYFNSITKNLNERQKEIVSMKILGDLKYHEIASILNIPQGTVQWIYNTSIKRLRRELAGIITVVFVTFINAIYQIKTYMSELKMMHGMDVTFDESEILLKNKYIMIISLILFVLAVILTIFFLKFRKIANKK